MNKRLERLHAQRDKIKDQYGNRSAFMAQDVRYSRDAISTGWMMLDYISGIGGVPRCHQVEVYGQNDIGKSTHVGVPVLREAQAMGLLVAVVALEPSFDPDWARRLGLDLERCLIVYPDNGLEAFEVLHDLVTGKDTGGEPVIDYVLFDSIGAVSKKEEAEKGTPSAYGASQMITSATRTNLMPCFKNNIGIMYLNQVREDTNAMTAFTAYTSPGGEALKHNVMQRVFIRPGGTKKTETVRGMADTQVGWPLVARMERNKLAEGAGQKATGDFYHVSNGKRPLGLDRTKDVIDTAMLAGVFEKNGGWYIHPSFPKSKNGKHQLQGAPAIHAHFAENPGSVAAIREDVMAVMRQKVAEHQAREREKEQ